MKTLELIDQKFARETESLDGPRFEQALHTLELLQLIPERILQPPQFSELLKWHERLLRALERGSAVDGAAWLAVNTSNPAALWLKLRRPDSELTLLEQSQLEDLTSSTKLGLALLQKLKLKTQSSEEGLRQAMVDYCAWLDANEVKTREIAGDAFVWDQTLEPGCIRLTDNKSPSDTIKHASSAPVTMAFDSLLFTAGWNLKLSAPSFDGSFVDLSTELKHMDLPVEPPLEEDHAITFPLLMGIRIASNIFPEGPGTYYFVYHYTARKAAAGRPGVAVPLTGYPGGNFDLQVASLGETHVPEIASLGGPGQKGVPRRKGGNASESEILWYPLKIALESSEPEFPAAQAVPLADPTIKKIDQLFKNGEADASGNLRLFLEPRILLANLLEPQKAKALTSCPQGESDFACWEKTSIAAAVELWNRYAELCPVSGGARVCPIGVLEKELDRLNSSYFKEPEGALGPVNPDGQTGENGKLNLEIQ